ncbi:DUF1566 domain-containing protein [Candidatus Magnetaquicoccus inordinatus]|uniref:Lcl C-terminal domain-containing protein n=1 Tax=Candidatus Magnetaquicoccus inordinatus TaxID=2496818 RepID=UPI00187D4E23|nr:DUF1566 domain-containing protein [Candidatus Magnetaquicoccus inordinatus]
MNNRAGWWKGAVVIGLCSLLGGGFLQAGERYTNNNNGTITDHKSKLVALADGNCLQKMTWDEAMAEVGRLASGKCGLTDGSAAGNWRLPTKRELGILVDWRKSGKFVALNNDFYWSGTVNEEDSKLAWLIFLATVYIGNDLKSDKNMYWPVRDAH